MIYLFGVSIKNLYISTIRIEKKDHSRALGNSGFAKATGMNMAVTISWRARLVRKNDRKH